MSVAPPPLYSLRPTSRLAVSTKCFLPKGWDKNERKEIRSKCSLTGEVCEFKARLKTWFNELHKETVVAQEAGQLQTEKSQKKSGNKDMRERKCTWLICFPELPFTKSLQSNLQLKKGQAHWPLQKIHGNQAKQLLLGFWQKKKNKPRIKWRAK